MAVAVNCYLPTLVEKKIASRKYGLHCVAFDEILFQKFYLNYLGCEGYIPSINEICLDLSTCESTNYIEPCPEFLIRGITQTFSYSEIYLDNPYYATQIHLELNSYPTTGNYYYEWVFDTNYFAIASTSQNGGTSITLDIIVDLTQFPFYNTQFIVNAFPIGREDCPPETESITLLLEIFERPCELGADIIWTSPGDGKIYVEIYPYNVVGTPTWEVTTNTGTFDSTGTNTYYNPLQQDLLLGDLVFPLIITGFIEDDLCRYEFEHIFYFSSCEEEYSMIQVIRVGNQITLSIPTLPPGNYAYYYMLGSLDNINFNIHPESPISTLATPTATIIASGSTAVTCLVYNLDNMCVMPITGIFLNFFILD